ncbi:hypothetical protein LJ737_11345 [Hymenobacter sp. 15J16-1T3B]|uniref:HD domain-containing protein n=1 Tax=Hymenobacter sp. 15J16-1T3B TaxID=2886941 RepID=UPI001D1008DA|nr:hypothetical protein [Hymenobacter sp. 15J16-1T3B]MCC3157834.1 hypothetical protein [Hymenobacter sp. 15J16-1T3B]
MTLTLEARWQQLLTPLTADADLRRRGYQQLHDAYAQSGRHYHALPHIRQMLEALDPRLAALQDAVVVQLAVWFHDVVYSPLRSDNEARSAEMARQFLAQTSLSAARRERVAFLIERTKDHTQPQPAADTDLHLLLDADLQILGAPEADYWRYARQVRQEYALVPDILYRRGRQDVLQKFLALPHVYQTEEFRRLEPQARRNLRAELEAWQQNRF